MRQISELHSATRHSFTREFDFEFLVCAVSAFQIFIYRCFSKPENIHTSIGANGVDGVALAKISLSLNDETLLPVLDGKVRVALNNQFENKFIPGPVVLRWVEADSANPVEVSIEVNSSVFQEIKVKVSRRSDLNESVPDFSSVYRTVINDLLTGVLPDVQSVTLLDAHAMHFILNELSGRKFQADESLKSQFLYQVFEKSAARNPAAVAVECEGVACTYAELNNRAQNFATVLKARDIGAGKFVALLLPRGIDVYVAILGILKSGAAYVPMDPDYPEERIKFILNDCGASAVIAEKTLAERNNLQEFTVLSPAELSNTAASDVFETNLKTSDAAYVIYTSGTTGKPKGVQIPHASACHFVSAEVPVIGVKADDRVFQGFSIAFDASLEEIWLAFAAGATLVVGTKKLMQLGSGLSRALSEAGITVWSTVPTLLAIQDEPVSTLKILIVGGEECSEALVSKWAVGSLKMFNTYGPTEATVVATYAQCHAGQAVTIGKPLPGYHVYVVDEKLKPVPAGVAGELLIGGSALATGYLNIESAPGKGFVKSTLPGTKGRLYRTGDLVRHNRNGDLEYLGRIDDQVKVRGFRIELGEIEARLSECPGVRSAAVAVLDVSGLKSIAGFIVETSPGAFDSAQSRVILKRLLPAFMVPQSLSVIPVLPILSSGKVDRKALKKLSVQPEKQRTDCIAPRNSWEQKIFEVWSVLVQTREFSVTDNFFDLGGHSLLATRMVSELRRDADLAGLSIADVYSNQTLEALAKHAETLYKAECESRVATCTPAAAPVKRNWLFEFSMQSSGLYFFYAILTISWIATWQIYNLLRAGVSSGLGNVLLAVGIFLASSVLQITLPVALKWIVIGRFKEGRYQVWSSYYWRFWMVRTALDYFGPAFINATPFANMYYRMLGAKIGKNVHLGSDQIIISDLLTIGDNSSLGKDSRLRGYYYEKNELVIGPIDIGENCYIGCRSVLRPFVRMKNDAQLGELSFLDAGSVLGTGESWAGSPARPVNERFIPQPDAKNLRTKQSHGGLLTNIGYGAVILALWVLPFVTFVPVFLGVSAIARTFGPAVMYASLPIDIAAFVVLISLLIAALKWIFVGKVQEGTWSVDSAQHFKLWFLDCLLDFSGDILHPLYGTLYLNSWLRLLGARIGKQTEVSTACNFIPDLVQIGDKCFVADDVCLGASRVHQGYVVVKKVVIEDGVFVGNSAVVPQGSTITKDTLVGCLSMTPEARLQTPGTAVAQSWVGSPPILLPKREASAFFGDRFTFNPPKKLVAARLFVEFFKITLPGSFYFVLTRAFLNLVSNVMTGPNLALHVLLLPCALAASGAGAAIFTMTVKWLLMGRYQAGEKPLWCSFVWMSELCNSVHEQLTETMFSGLVLGTPLIALYFRMLGSKVGANAMIETTNLTEFDLVEIGEGACVGTDCDLQTHLFEDRVMKMSHVTVGKNATVGEATLVLYDAEVGENCGVGGLSLVMKGESLPVTSDWHGIPIQRRIAAVQRTAAPSQKVSGIHGSVVSSRRVARPVAAGRFGADRIPAEISFRKG